MEVKLYIHHVNFIQKDSVSCTFSLTIAYVLLGLIKYYLELSFCIIIIFIIRVIIIINMVIMEGLFPYPLIKDETFSLLLSYDKCTCEHFQMISPM